MMMNTNSTELSVYDIFSFYQSLRAQGCAAPEASMRIERYGAELPRLQWQRVQKAIREYEIQANWDELYI